MSHTFTREEYQDTLHRIHRMKVAELKDLCRASGLRLIGLKQVLITRLEDKMGEARSQGSDSMLLAIRTLVLKRCQGGEPLPNLVDLHNAIVSGGFTVPVPNQYSRSAPSVARRDDQSVPYTGSSIHFAKNPFYQLKRMIHGSPQLCNAVNNARSVVQLCFTLDTEELKLFDPNGTIRIMLYCGPRTNSTSASNDVLVQFPHPSDIHVNGTFVVSNHRGIKNRVGTAKPADITSLIKKSGLNTVQLGYTHADTQFLLYAYFVQILPTSVALAEIVKNPPIHKNSTIALLREDEADDIQQTSIIITLRDPVSYTRMAYPARSISCDHIQCFDAHIWLESQLQLPTWTCPICQKKIKLENVAICSFFKEILESVPESVDTITLNMDGTWSMEEQAQEVKQTRTENPRTENPRMEDVEIFSLDTDSEDEPQVEEEVEVDQDDSALVIHADEPSSDISSDQLFRDPFDAFPVMPGSERITPTMPNGRQEVNAVTTPLAMEQQRLDNHSIQQIELNANKEGIAERARIENSRREEEAREVESQMLQARMKLAEEEQTRQNNYRLIQAQQEQQKQAQLQEEEQRQAQLQEEREKQIQIQIEENSRIEAQQEQQRAQRARAEARNDRDLFKNAQSSESARVVLQNQKNLDKVRIREEALNERCRAHNCPTSVDWKNFMMNQRDERNRYPDMAAQFDKYLGSNQPSSSKGLHEQVAEFTLAQTLLSKPSQEAHSSDKSHNHQNHQNQNSDKQMHPFFRRASSDAATLQRGQLESGQNENHTLTNGAPVNRHVSDSKPDMQGSNFSEERASEVSTSEPAAGSPPLVARRAPPRIALLDADVSDGARDEITDDDLPLAQIAKSDSVGHFGNGDSNRKHRISVPPINPQGLGQNGHSNSTVLPPITSIHQRLPSHQELTQNTQNRNLNELLDRSKQQNQQKESETQHNTQKNGQNDINVQTLQSLQHSEQRENLQQNEPRWNQQGQQPLGQSQNQYPKPQLQAISARSNSEAFPLSPINSPSPDDTRLYVESCISVESSKLILRQEIVVKNIELVISKLRFVSLYHDDVRSKVNEMNNLKMRQFVQNLDSQSNKLAASGQLTEDMKAHFARMKSDKMAELDREMSEVQAKQNLSTEKFNQTIVALNREHRIIEVILALRKNSVEITSASVNSIVSWIVREVTAQTVTLPTTGPIIPSLSVSDNSVSSSNAAGAHTTPLAPLLSNANRPSLTNTTSVPSIPTQLPAANGARAASISVASNQSSQTEHGSYMQRLQEQPLREITDTQANVSDLYRAINKLPPVKQTPIQEAQASTPTQHLQRLQLNLEPQNGHNKYSARLNDKQDVSIELEKVHSNVRESSDPQLKIPEGVGKNTAVEVGDQQNVEAKQDLNLQENRLDATEASAVSRPGVLELSTQNLARYPVQPQASGPEARHIEPSGNSPVEPFKNPLIRNESGSAVQGTTLSQPSVLPQSVGTPFTKTMGAEQIQGPLQKKQKRVVGLLGIEVDERMLIGDLNGDSSAKSTPVPTPTDGLGSRGISSLLNTPTSPVHSTLHTPGLPQVPTGYSATPTPVSTLPPPSRNVNGKGIATEAISKHPEMQNLTNGDVSKRNGSNSFTNIEVIDLTSDSE